MKKSLFICVCLLAVFMAASCASTKKAESSTDKAVSSSGKTSASVNQTGRRANSGIPKSIRDAISKVPEDTLVGVGTAKMASLSQSRTISQTRARAELSRQMDTVVRDMVRDYTAGSEVDPSAVLSFQENITVALSQARLVGASIIEEDQDANGNYWTAITLNKNGAVNEINQAVAAAKLRVPAMASFNAQERMDKAFDKLYGNEIGYSDSN
jgi:hypothetical protein